MTARVREHATYEDLLQVPDHLVAELIEGELYTSARPAGPHTNAASTLGALLLLPFRLGRGGPGGWWILDEPELHLSHNILVPDLAGWRCERMPEIPRTHVFDIVPDWVCEVLSPSTGRIDRAKKLPIYARNGVAFCWLVDVEQQVLEVKRLQNGHWSDLAYFTADQPVRAEPFEAIELDMTHVWGPAAS